jgi:hypothetical protein
MQRKWPHPAVTANSSKIVSEIDTPHKKYYWINSGFKMNLGMSESWQLGFLQRQKFLSPNGSSSSHIGS